MLLKIRLLLDNVCSGSNVGPCHVICGDGFPPAIQFTITSLPASIKMSSGSTWKYGNSIKEKNY